MVLQAKTNLEGLETVPHLENYCYGDTKQRSCDITDCKCSKTPSKPKEDRSDCHSSRVFEQDSQDNSPSDECHKRAEKNTSVLVSVEDDEKSGFKAGKIDNCQEATQDALRKMKNKGLLKSQDIVPLDEQQLHGTNTDNAIMMPRNTLREKMESGASTLAQLKPRCSPSSGLGDVVASDPTLDFNQTELSEDSSSHDLEIGAIAVVGIDGVEEEDFDFHEEYDTNPSNDAQTNTSPQPANMEGLVEALLVTEEEDEDVGLEQTDSNRVVAFPVKTEDLKTRGMLEWIRRNKLLVVLACSFSLAITIAVSIISAETASNTSKDFPPFPVSDRFKQALPLVQTITPMAFFANKATPQYLALTWLADKDEAVLDFASENSSALQRYALAVVYFATTGNDWNYQYKFLSPANECDWTGVDEAGASAGVSSCNQEGFVTGLALGKHLELIL